MFTACQGILSILEMLITDYFWNLRWTIGTTKYLFGCFPETNKLIGMCRCQNCCKLQVSVVAEYFFSSVLILKIYGQNIYSCWRVKVCELQMASLYFFYCDELKYSTFECMTYIMIYFIFSIQCAIQFYLNLNYYFC